MVSGRRMTCVLVSERRLFARYASTGCGLTESPRTIQKQRNRLRVCITIERAMYKSRCSTAEYRGVQLSDKKNRARGYGYARLVLSGMNGVYAVFSL